MSSRSLASSPLTRSRRIRVPRPCRRAPPSLRRRQRRRLRQRTRPLLRKIHRFMQRRQNIPPPKCANKEEGKSEHPKAIPVDAAKTYVVAKGDNPARIAKKLKVPYDELLSVNHIDDPHKLQIGQKLIIPTKPRKRRRSRNEAAIVSAILNAQEERVLSVPCGAGRARYRHRHAFQHERIRASTAKGTFTSS